LLSVIIPSRNEIYLQKTIENVLSNAEGEIEIIAILDGYLPEPQIVINDNRVIFVHYEKSVGQRVAINQGARMAHGKYIMKLDAHCAVDKGFDVKLVADCEYDWTVIPRMYNLDHETWQPKLHKKTDYMYIGNGKGRELRAEYYNSRQPKNGRLIDDTMCCMGPCFFMHKDRFWELDGLDENHGGWGQMGVEVSCKAWLSGGSLKVNKNTWFAHWFRGGGGPGFPYKISGRDQEKARKYSKDLWLNNKWPLQKRDFQWLVEKFKPPTWDNDLTVLFYTSNVISNKILDPVVRSLKRHNLPIVSISQKKMELGTNIVVPKERSLQNIYRQVLSGAKKATTKYVALCEDDCLYISEHFQYRPKKAPFAYNLNRWLLHLNEKVFSYRKRPILSQCIADREVLIKNLEERLALPSIPDEFCGEMGCFEKQLGMTEYAYETFETKQPNLVVCHKQNIMGRKYIGKDAEPKTELLPWGDVNYWVNKFHGTYRQHSHIHGKPFKIDEIMDNLEHYWDWRKMDRLPVYKMAAIPFYQAVHEGKQFTDEELKAHPYFTYLISRMRPETVERKDVIERCLYLIKKGIDCYHSIKDNGMYHPIDMWWEKGKLNLYRGSRRLIIAKLLGYQTIPVRMFNSREMMMKLLPSRDDEPNDSTIHGLAIKQFVKFQDRATDKYWIHGYTPLYDTHLGKLREKANKILEIGVWRGASLLLWCDAFPNAEIYGVDKNIKQATMIKDNPRIHLLEGQQEDEQFLKDKVIPQSPFDIIIDDGGHRSVQQKQCLKLLWDSLNKGGFYVIEDLFSNYWKERENVNTIQVLKDMIDELNLKLDIASMHLYYNICFIEKR
jgi:glycosyltransferase involved in cell wall biosynthesis